MKKHSVLAPSYTKHFKCIGGECEDSCCIGWNITIDKKSFKNYKKVINKDFKNKLQRYVKKNRHSISENDYAVIKLLKDKSCPFLNNEKLCEVFINIGEKSLSKTCTTYPRVYNKVDNVLEKSLTLSCPVAARTVLLNKNLMEFDEIQSDEVLGVIQRDIDTKSKLEHNNKYFWDLRIFVIDLLQNREYCIEDRLIILGLFCNELKENSDISGTIQKFKNRILNNTYKEFLNEITDKLNIKLNILKQIIDARIESFDSGEFLEFYNKSIKGLQFKKGIDISEAYNLCYTNYYKSFNLNNEYIMENFLVNYVFQHMFPLGYRKIFDEYMMMIVYYSLVKIHLVGLSGYYKEDFSEEIAVQFIQKFSKLVLHDNRYIQWIFDAIKENNIDSMAYMAIFIKR